MTNIAFKTAFAAILVAAPLAGAHAGPAMPPAPEDIVYSRSLAVGSVDGMTTGSIGATTPAMPGSPADATYRAAIDTLQRGAANVSLDQLLASQIRAAEIEVNATRSGFVDEGRVAQIRSELASIRQQANGGVSEASYQALSQQLQAVNKDIYALTRG